MKILLFSLSLLFIGFFPSQIFADVDCTVAANKQNVECILGKIQAPSPLADLLAEDQTGAGAISRFLSNLVALFFSLGAIVAVFMLLWAAFEWMTSGGEKEKVAAARNKIIYAIIGIILFALAFAILRIVGVFTGFSFFRETQSTSYCYQGFTLNSSKNPPVCVNDLDLSERPAIRCNQDQVFDAGKGECKTVNRRVP